MGHPDITLDIARAALAFAFACYALGTIQCAVEAIVSRGARSLYLSPLFLPATFFALIGVVALLASFPV